TGPNVVRAAGGSLISSDLLPTHRQNTPIPTISYYLTSGYVPNPQNLFFLGRGCNFIP
ncbi:unnamed protein product, partial [Ectocarpus fasciculatus]